MSEADRYYVSWEEMYKRVAALPDGKVYGIPRGGSVVAGLTGRAVESPEDADYIVDDLRDSGRTGLIYANEYGKPIKYLFDKQTEKDLKNKWLVFPYEGSPIDDIKSHVLRILEYIGEDPTREGLRETPARVVRSWNKLFGGYKEKVEDVLKVFSNEDQYDEIVLLKNVEFYSTCEHHFLPFTGKISVGYIPNKKIVGVSKLARIVEVFSRRLQIQERMTVQIAEAIEKALEPQGVMVVCEAVHMCMTSRGVQKQNSKMVTSAVRGVFKDNSKTRSEFLDLVTR